VVKHGNPEKEERPLLEAVTRVLVKTVTESTSVRMCVCVCVSNSGRKSVVKSCALKCQKKSDYQSKPSQ
jgi:hypothetical protein